AVDLWDHRGPDSRARRHGADPALLRCEPALPLPGSGTLRLARRHTVHGVDPECGADSTDGSARIVGRRRPGKRSDHLIERMGEGGLHRGGPTLPTTRSERPGPRKQPRVPNLVHRCSTNPFVPEDGSASNGKLSVRGESVYGNVRAGP